MKKGQKRIMSKPVFIEYDGESKKAELIKLFEEETEKKLYPAQVENILINLIEYKAMQLVAAFNEAALLNLPQYSHGEILDLIGEMFNCVRLKGAKAQATIKIELYEAFTSSLTIPKGLEVQTKDEKYIFTTTEDLIIKAGDTVGTVTIESEDLAEELNNYGVGDINILLKPVSYIKSVTNITAATGGKGKEIDKNYAERILLAPEGFTCAGSQKSYIYHTLSAHPAIIDATADSPQLPASIKKGETTITETGGSIVGADFSATINYKSGTCVLTIGENVYTITIPPQSTVNIYPLTDEDTTSQAVINAVANKLTGEEINPMTDVVNVIAPTAKEQAITINVVLDLEADIVNVQNSVLTAVNEYKKVLRKKLQSEIIPSQIIAKIGNIEGVYSVDCGNLTQITANVNEYFNLVPTINFSTRSL